MIKPIYYKINIQNTFRYSCKLYKYPSEQYNKLKPELQKLSGDFNFSPISKESYILCAFNEDVLIGFIVIVDLELLDDDTDVFIEKGGIRNRPGLFITSLYKNNNYKDVKKILLENIYIYSRNNDYVYLLTHVAKDNIKLTEFYKTENFEINKKLTRQNDVFSIMYKYLL